MKPNFNGCTLQNLEIECHLCTHRTTNGGNPILLNKVIEVSDLDGVNVEVGDIICISCGDDHSGAFHNASWFDHAVSSLR